MPQCVASIHALELESVALKCQHLCAACLLLSLKLLQTQHPMLIVRWGLDQPEVLLSAT
jgi:hypothetical protein